MQEPRHDKSRSGFQLERLSFFTDGVFAICITLLIIEIKVPVLSDFSDHELFVSLSHSAMKFLGFLISFAIVGHYWSVHHRIFGYDSTFNSTLLWINMGFLLSVVLLPFSSGLLAEYGSHGEMFLPYAIYVLNMSFTGLMNTWLWIYISSPKRHFLTHKISRDRINLGIYRSLLIPVIFLVSLCLTFIWPIGGRLFPFITPLILHFGFRRLERKADKELAAEPAPAEQPAVETA